MDSAIRDDRCSGMVALVLYSYAPETTSLYSLRHSADSQCCLEPDFFGTYPTYGVAGLWVALVVIYLLLLTVMVSIKVFASVSKIAAWLFVPYGLWVAYASTLNLYMALHN